MSAKSSTCLVSSSTLLVSCFCSASAICHRRKPDLRTTFLDHLNSPYGVVLVGDQLYVANTDAILSFRYIPGQTRITEPGWC